MTHDRFEVEYRTPVTEHQVSIVMSLSGQIFQQLDMLSSESVRNT